MQALLASLVIGMSVKDEAFRAAMATNRAEVKRTGQEFDRGADQMAGAIERGARAVNAAALRIVDSVANIGRAVNEQGLKLTAGLTLPLGLLAHTANGTASDFQAAMNNVKAAMLDADPKDLEKLRLAALALGPAMGKSAIEAASAIEGLAKNGMAASEILGGGLENALKLGVLGQTDLGKAADATTDILQQFHLTASALPGIVNKVSGALDASKLDFNGYADAIGMVGGIAGGLGYSFEDMNTALAAVIPLMTGGSDAGTSFKTFLLSLVPQSKDAAEVMTKLGISFSNADGSMKTLSEAAEVLNTRMSMLNDKSKQDALTRMFGTDGMRVALALMQAGAKGIADVQAQIDKANASQKIAVLLDGEAAATQRMASSWEQLKIAVGGAGIIQAYTAVKDAIASVTGAIASAPPWFFKLSVGVGALAAAIGPLILIGTKLATLVLPLLLLRLGPLALGFAAIINPVGVLIRLLGQLALQAGAATVIGRLGTSMVASAGMVGLLVTALSLVIPLYMEGAKASDKLTAALDQSKTAHQGSIALANELATATDKTRAAILAKAKADRAAALAAIQSARATLAAARAESERARQQAANPSLLQRGYNFLSGGSSHWERSIDRWAAGKLGMNITPDQDAATANYRAAVDAQRENLARFDAIDGAIKAAEGAGSAPRVDMTFDDAGKNKTRTPKSRDTSADDDDYGAKLADVRNAELQARAELTGSITARYRADMDGLASDRAAFARELATDQRLTDAKRATLMAEKDKEIATRSAIIEQTRTNALAQESYDLARADNDARQEIARANIDLADSAAGRKDGELRLLDLQRRQEEADLDLILATKNTATAEWENAKKRRDALAGVYQQRADAIGRQNETPADQFVRRLNRSAAAIDEDVQASAVSALDNLNTGLTDALTGTGKLADAFENMGRRIIASLIDIAVQQAIIKPLATSLFGAVDASGGRSGGALAGIGSFLSRTFGGGKATGGPIDSSSWYVVGERGPEIFAPGVSGTVIPNGGKGTRSASSGGSPYYDLRGAVVTQDLLDQMNAIGQAAQAGAIGAVEERAAQKARRRM